MRQFIAIAIFLAAAMASTGCTKTTHFNPAVDEGQAPSGRCLIKTTDGRSYTADNPVLTDSTVVFRAVDTPGETSQHHREVKAGMIEIPIGEVSSIERKRIDLITPMLWTSAAFVAYVMLAVLAIQ